jgi:chromosome segregation ATPase
MDISLLSDAEKIERLWQRLETLHQENADLQLRLQLATKELQRSQAELAQARAHVHSIEGSLLEACREVNAARAAAAAHAASLRTAPAQAS